MNLGVAQEKHPGVYFSPGEIVIKFAGGSRGAELSTRALADQKPSDAELSAYIESISSEVHVPLKVERFGSGGSLVLSVQQPALAADLVRQLGEASNVVGVHMIVEQSQPAIQVEFQQNSWQQQVLARAEKGGAEAGAQVDKVTRKLEDNCGVPLASRVVSANKLQVTPDIQKLTVDLAARLSKRRDVEYAQPNFIRRPTGATNGFH